MLDPQSAAVKIAEQLMKQFSELKIADALKIAVEINRNEIFERAFCTWDEHSCVALEAIAMALGYKPKN